MSDGRPPVDIPQPAPAPEGSSGSGSQTTERATGNGAPTTGGTEVRLTHADVVGSPDPHQVLSSLAEARGEPTGAPEPTTVPGAPVEAPLTPTGTEPAADAAAEDPAAVAAREAQETKAAKRDEWRQGAADRRAANAREWGEKHPRLRGAYRDVLASGYATKDYVADRIKNWLKIGGKVVVGGGAAYGGVLLVKGVGVGTVATGGGIGLGAVAGIAAVGAAGAAAYGIGESVAVNTFFRLANKGKEFRMWRMGGEDHVRNLVETFRNPQRCTPENITLLSSLFDMQKLQYMIDRVDYNRARAKTGGGFRVTMRGLFGRGKTVAGEREERDKIVKPVKPTVA